MNALKNSFLPLLILLLMILAGVLAMDSWAASAADAYTVVHINKKSSLALNDDGVEDNQSLVLDGDYADNPRLKQMHNLILQGNWSEAGALIDSLLKENPGNPQYVYEASALRLKQNDPAGARELLAPLLTQSQKDHRLWFLSGVVESHLKNSDAAIKGYGTALSLKPAHFESAYNLGLLYLEKSDLEKAENLLEQARKNGAGKLRAMALFSLARVHNKAGRIDRAEKLYLKSIEYQPDYLLPRLNLALLLDRRNKNNDRKTARDMLTQLTALAPDFAPAYFSMARLASRDGNRLLAEKWYRTAMQVDPSFWKARFNFGLLLIKKGDLQQAADHFLQMRKDFPERAEVPFYQGKIAYSSNNPEQAEAFYRQAIAQRQGKYPEAAVNLALVLKSTGRREDALSGLEEVLKDQPANGAALVNRALILQDLKRYDEARVSYLAAAATESGVTALYNLGVLESRLDRDVQAMEAYRKVLSKDPDHIKSATNLGSLLSNAGNFSEAESLLRKVVERAPANESAHNSLALILRKAGKLDQAIAEYRTAIALNPENETSMNNLGVALAKKGDSEAAAQIFADLLERTPSNVKTRYNLALQYTRLNRAEEAEVELRKVLGLDPEHVQSHITLARIYLQRSEHGEALKLVNRALELSPNNADARSLKNELKQ